MERIYAESRKLMVGFNIAEFSSYIKELGVLKSDKFLVRFTLPPAFAKNVDMYNTVRRLEFWCESAKVPGVQLNLHEVKRYGYGISEKKPTNAVFGDIPFIFIGDGKGDILEFFQQWVSLISPFDLSNGITNGSVIQPMELTYKYEYAVDMDVIAYDESGEERIHIKLRDAFPYSVAPIDLAWTQRNEIMRIPVIFTFTDWYNEKLLNTPIDLNSLNNLNIRP